MLWRQGRLTDEALVGQLEMTRSSHPSSWVDLYLLAQVHLERGDVEAAEKVLAEAAAQAPEVQEVQEVQLVQQVQEVQMPVLIPTLYQEVLHSSHFR